MTAVDIRSQSGRSIAIAASCRVTGKEKREALKRLQQLTVCNVTQQSVVSLTWRAWDRQPLVWLE